ncbi:hypothetical protein EVAR_39223_1 [Eumeta japonica]|uniref:Uncharacterized protein n=1 Tax=Eumeta variegata TaxID=151549 RepID=A0A4C1VQC8_EUMVA|nr:hypothetical protein EVAR_39223_1 [Eumeta japonica]
MDVGIFYNAHTEVGHRKEQSSLEVGGSRKSRPHFREYHCTPPAPPAGPARLFKVFKADKMSAGTGRPGPASAN